LQNGIKISNPSPYKKNLGFFLDQLISNVKETTMNKQKRMGAFYNFEMYFDKLVWGFLHEVEDPTPHFDLK
jgi:hypothetical protein